MPELLGGWYYVGVAYEFGVIGLMVVLILLDLWDGDTRRGDERRAHEQKLANGSAFRHIDGQP